MVVKNKTIEIPIYCGKLTMLLVDSLKYIEEEYKTPPLDDYGAVTLKDETSYRHYVTAFTDKEHLSNIAHEIVHVKNYIYSDCAMELDVINDEPEAYLTGWLFEQIYNLLK